MDAIKPRIVLCLACSSFFPMKCPSPAIIKNQQQHFFGLFLFLAQLLHLISPISPHSPTTKFKQNALGFVDPVRVDVFKSDSPKFLLHVGR
jgi:hypothetical protein